MLGILIWPGMFLIARVSTKGNLRTGKQFAEGIFEIGRQSPIRTMRTNPFNLKIPSLFLASFLGYRLYFNSTRILNLNVVKVIRRINKFMKG